MTVHRFTPRGSVSDAKIDELLEQFEPDEWLPTALKVPYLVGIFSCGLMAVALTLVFFAPRFTQVALTISFLWPIAVTFSFFSMSKLARHRQAEVKRNQNDKKNGRG